MAGIELDPGAGRAYVLNESLGLVKVYSVADSRFDLVGTIAAGLESPHALAIDPVSHTLFVGQRTAVNSVLAVDVRPGSASEFRVIDRFTTEATSLDGLRVDARAHRLFVINSSVGVSVIDMASHAVIQADTHGAFDDIVLDGERHMAYVANTTTGVIYAIASDGTVVPHPVASVSGALAMSDGVLYVATIDRGVAKVLALDPANWEIIAESGSLNRTVRDLAIDRSNHTVYALYASIGSMSIRMLRSTDLTMTGDVVTSDVARVLDSMGDGRLFGIEEGIGAVRALMYRSTINPVSAVDRIGGADRFVVAAAVSRDTFEAGVPVAYVTTGSGFADALSGSAAAGVEGGPILLANRDAVPEATALELARLTPKRIVILGGRSALGDEVEAQLLTTGVPVTRIGGADRFAVSAAVSQAAFPGGAKTVYLASGTNFPDALSGAAAAGSLRGPVLLVQKHGIPEVIAAELDRLNPDLVVVLGGPAAVDDFVVDWSSKKRSTIRIGGADRYVVSSSVSADRYRAGIDTVYVASGEVFADALAGSASAIVAHSPVLLVTTDFIPPAIAAELDRLNPYRIVVLGGKARLSDSLLAQLSTYLSAPSR